MVVRRVDPGINPLTGKRKKRSGTPRPRKGFTHGGARPKGGKSGEGKGAAAIKRQMAKNVLAEVLPKGITPLEHMLNVMRENCPKNATVKEQLIWREQTMRAAISAAPYCHPRLQATVNPLDATKPPEENINIIVRFVSPTKDDGNASD